MSDLSINRERRARSRTKTYEIAISGLLTRRADLVGGLNELEARISELQRDVAAMDRVLASLGYGGDLEAVPPRRPCDAPFRRGQVMRAVCDALRAARTPLTPRQIAEACLPALGHDRDEDVPIGILARRVSQSLQRLKKAGSVVCTIDAVRNAVWSFDPNG